jgi:glycosyltransferase involved in cell wall biosynthesis
VLVAHPSADLYGSDRVLLESVAGMVAEGWRVLVALPGPGPLVAEITARGAEVEYCSVPVVRKSALRPRGFARFVLDLARTAVPVCRLILRSGASSVYVNTITIPSWLVLGRLTGRRVICHVHEAEGSAAAVIRRLLNLPLVLAQGIIVNSAFSQLVLLDAIPFLRRRTVVVYNGVPGPAAPPPARLELAPPVRVLFVGRLSPRKGPQVAVRALELLHHRGARVRLDLLGAVFPGYEWFETELRDAVASAGLDDAVTFLGFDAEVWPHIARSDVVVVPSVVDEPFGNTAVEAVLGARPLVVSATSGLREASAGYQSAQQVPPDRPDLLADAVERVIADWDRYRAMAAADAALARERHSVLRYQRDIIAALSRPSPG